MTLIELLYLVAVICGAFVGGSYAARWGLLGNFIGCIIGGVLGYVLASAIMLIFVIPVWLSEKLDAWRNKQ